MDQVQLVEVLVPPDHVDVAVEQAGKQRVAGRVDLLVPVESGPDLQDPAILDDHVGPGRGRARAVEHHSAGEHCPHGRPLLSHCAFRGGRVYLRHVRLFTDDRSGGWCTRAVADATSMNAGFIPTRGSEGTVARRTLFVPEAVDALVKEMADEGESYSATVARLIEAGARALRGRRMPSYVATGDGPEDLGILAETYLRRLVRSR